jgi:ribosomal protein S18 acetylase RimI-like enzyme
MTTEQMAMQITIRRATMDDLAFLRKMIWEGIYVSKTLITYMGMDQIQRFEDEYWQKWEQEPEPGFVAVDADGRKVGAVTLKANDKDQPVSGWRIGIGVEADRRGQGIGSRLIERAIEYAREQRATYISLSVDPVNPRAVALYRRMGFVETTTDKPWLYMRQNLG